MGQNGISVSLHSDGDRIIIDGSGTGGIDPTYMTLANDEITMHKDVMAGAIGASSLAISTGGSIMCFGNITAAFGGIMYANSGLECSSMLCQGNSNINTLTVQQDTTSNNLTLGGKIIYQGADALSFDGSGNMILNKPVQFPSGFTSSGVCGFTANFVFNEVAMNELNTPAINIQMPGLSSHISVNDTARISFTRLKTQIHNDLEVLGNISVTTTDLSEYQKHASSHL